MRIDEIWIYLLAAATAVVLLIGLAQVLEDPRRRLRREGWTRRRDRPTLEPLVSTPISGSLQVATSAALAPPATELAPPAAPPSATESEAVRARPAEPGASPHPAGDLEPVLAPPQPAEPAQILLSPIEPEPQPAEPAQILLSPIEPEPQPAEPAQILPPPVEAETYHTAGSEVSAQVQEPSAESVSRAEERSEPPLLKPLIPNDIEPTPLDRCLKAHEEGDHAGAAAASEAIARPKGNRKRPRKGAAPESPAEQAAAWTILGLARRALGNQIGSRVALESAGRWASDVKRSSPAPAAPGLEARLGRLLLAAGEAASEGSEGRRLGFRLAAVWLGWALESDAADADLSALRARAIQGFDTATERRVGDLMARRDFAAAQRPIEEALASGLLATERRDAFRDLFWTSLTGEVGRLIGQALHAAEEDPPGDPMAKLAEAQAVVDAVPASSLSLERGHDLARRLWWAQMKLGTQRMESGHFDGALDLLFRCLELAEGDAERQAETRQTLSHAVGGIVEQLGEGSLARLRDGDVEAALAESRRLSEIVDRALQGGLTQEDLAAAIGRRQEIMLQIAEADRG